MTRSQQDGATMVSSGTPPWYYWDPVFASMSNPDV